MPDRTVVLVRLLLWIVIVAAAILLALMTWHPWIPFFGANR